MEAQRISLDGEWQFQYLGYGHIKPGESHAITVPAPWQASIADLRMRGGIGVYRREIEARWRDGRVFLHFGAVFHIAHVFVNGQFVGKHIGGFLPFHFDITDKLVDGRAELMVRVESPTDDPLEFPMTPFAEIPFGKQSWYGPLSGIWQSVWLERRIADHMAELCVRATLASGAVSAMVRFDRPLEEAAELRLTVRDRDGRAVGDAAFEAGAGMQNAELYTGVPQPYAWSPDDPYLYRMDVVMLRGGVCVDARDTTFGFRTIETRDGRLYLNGKPFYLRGALDQDYYPDTICTPPSLEFIEDRFRKAKELGLNALRCHIKAPDPRYYDAADRIGLLIWAELPNGGHSTAISRERKEVTLKGIIDRDGNHPSIFCWTLINENWGVDLVHDADHRAWLKKLFLWLKAYDPTRLVVDNSPLAPSFHIQTDLADFHFYAAIPDSRADWDKFVDELAGRADWLFSPEGDAVTTGAEPLLCSEFGNWGLPDPEKLKDGKGGEPWWFETGHDWSEGVMYAHGVRNRFRDWSLDRVFGRFEDFIEATQWQQFRALRYQIEAMRRRPEIAGYVITELTDCHWEANGLLDIFSNPRAFHDVFHTINAEVTILPRLARPAYRSAETANVRLSIANGGAATFTGARLDWRLDDAASSETLADVAPGVTDLADILLPLPRLDAPRRLVLELSLVVSDGRLLAQNSVDIPVHLPRESSGAVAVWSPDADLLRKLREHGYSLAIAPDHADVYIATAPSKELAAFVRGGGRALLLCDAPCSLTPFFPHWQNVKIVARDDTLWRGDWASTFAWLLRRGAFASIPGGPLLDDAFDRVIPRHVIVGCNLLDFHARVHAALVVGWIHRPAALAVERAYGAGHMVISTFQLLRDAPGVDPTAEDLLAALIQTARRRPAPELETLATSPDVETA